MGVALVNPRFFFTRPDTGAPLANGRVQVYVAGSTTPTPTWQDEGLTTLNMNPIQLDANGGATIWTDPAVVYKFEVRNAGGVVLYTVDNIKGAEPSNLRQLLAASAGSAMVGFLQSGAGAVLRTVQSKLRDVINVKDFGAVGDDSADDTAAIQAAITAAAGRPIFVPAGTYKITSHLTYTTAAVLAAGLKMYGEGQGKTFFDTRVAGAAMLSITGGTGGYTFQTGGFLRDFSIISNAVPVNSDGIEMRAVWHCDVERVSVKGLARYGVYVHSDVAPGDPDSSAYLKFLNCRMDENGYGFRLKSAVASLGVGFVTIENCSISNNTICGVSGYGVTNIYARKNGIVGNGASGAEGGVYIGYLGAGNQQIHFDDNEFGNGNTPKNCTIECAIGGSFNRNQITQNAGEAGNGTLVLGDGTNPVKDFDADGNRFRIDASINPHAAFTVRAGAEPVRISDTFWQSFGATGQTRYTLAATNVQIVEDNASRGDAIQYTTASVASGSYRPNMSEAVHHRIVVTATGAFTIPDPDFASSGRALELQIVNASSGAITVAFGSAFKVGGYTDPADNFRASARFTYDPTSVAWVQMGAWVANIPI